MRLLPSNQFIIRMLINKKVINSGYIEYVGNTKRTFIVSLYIDENNNQFAFTVEKNLGLFVFILFVYDPTINDYFQYSISYVGKNTYEKFQEIVERLSYVTSANSTKIW